MKLPQMGVAVLAWMVLAAASLAGCTGDDDPRPVPPPAPPPAVVEPAAALEIDLSSSTASTGKPITFKAIAKVGETSLASYKWRFSDGQQGAGPEFATSFSSAGRVDATLEATTAQGQVVTTMASLFVFDASGAPASSLGLPAVFGDLDGDAAVGLPDALLLAQALNGLVPLTPQQIQAGDLDLSGTLTAADLSLVMQAVLQGTRLPSALLNDYAYPAGLVTLVSPNLMDPDAVVEVRVGGVAAPKPIRIVLGYLTFIVPTAVAVTPTPAVVELVVNGIVADTLPLPLRLAPAMAANPSEDVLAFVAQTKNVLAQQQASLDKLSADSGIAAADQAVIVASAKAGMAMLDKASSDLQALFATARGAALASLFQKALYANGLGEFRSAAAALPAAAGQAASREPRQAALSGDQICDLLIPAVCGLKTTADVASKASDIFSASCSAVAATVFVGGLIFPADGPAIEAGALAAFLRICVPLSVAAEVGSIAGSLFSPLDLKLGLAASQATAGTSSTWHVAASVTFLGLREACAEGGSTLTGALAKKTLGNRIVALVMRKNASVKLLAEIFAKYSDDAYVALLKAIQDSVTNTLDATGLSDGFGKLMSTVCPNITGGAAAVPVSRVVKPPAQGEGVLQFNSDGSGTYSCPPAGPVFKSNVTLQGELKLCESTPAKAEAKVACVTSEVTITMGDNGSALDDIFEVVIDGATVLTSNAPVRSASTTLLLPQGRTTVTMRGLAAPDGIGTYFIGFSGAALVSGATSGTDLVPGTSKQFVIEVF